jgi:hypothetical protein
LVNKTLSPAAPGGEVPHFISKSMGVLYMVSRDNGFIEIKRGVFVEYNELQFHMKYENKSSWMERIKPCFPFGKAVVIYHGLNF